MELSLLDEEIFELLLDCFEWLKVIDCMLELNEFSSLCATMYESMVRLKTSKRYVLWNSKENLSEIVLCFCKRSFVALLITVFQGTPLDFISFEILTSGPKIS